MTSDKPAFSAYLGNTLAMLQRLGEGSLDQRVDDAVTMIADALRDGRSLLICGNGGSASDAMHIAGELVGRYLKERKGFRAIALSANPVVLTAWSNDYSYDTVFSRQVEALGEAGGVVWGISTSGNSKNVVLALEQARAMGMRTLALTGEGGGKMAALADILLDVPSRQTPRIQEAHLCLYHFICERVEEALS